MTAESALQKSCFASIDWKIAEDAKVIDMLKIMVANKIGAMGVTNAEGKVVGIVSERDYLSKVAFLGKTSHSTTVKEVRGARLAGSAPPFPVRHCAYCANCA